MYDIIFGGLAFRWTLSNLVQQFQKVGRQLQRQVLKLFNHLLDSHPS